MLTKQQVVRFQEHLKAERAHLLGKIKNLDDELAQNDYNYPLDWSDGAVRIYSDEDVMFERNRLQGELARVEHALSRIEAGSYGYSELSGQPIPVERLEALPTPTACCNPRNPATVLTGSWGTSSPVEIRLSSLWLSHPFGLTRLWSPTDESPNPSKAVNKPDPSRTCWPIWMKPNAELSSPWNAVRQRT